MNGSRIIKACKEVGISARTLQRWKHEDGLVDQRKGSCRTPANKLSEADEQKIIEICCSPEFVDKTPRKIVPLWADRGEYVASESSFYRVLKEHNLYAHRGTRKAPTYRRPAEVHITCPNQQWSWDISYLRTNAAGFYFYLYAFMDIYSRKIVGWEVYEEESAQKGKAVLEKALMKEGIHENMLFAPPSLHQDNGAPMRASEFTAFLESQGIRATYNRPHHSNDNPFSESLFATVKGRVTYPRRGFETIEKARQYMDSFVTWYNTEHLHSGIGFMTPEHAHTGKDKVMAERRNEVYAQARAQLPASRFNRGVKVHKGAQPVSMHRTRSSGCRISNMKQDCTSANKAA